MKNKSAWNPHSLLILIFVFLFRNGAFTLRETETDTETETKKKWPTCDCVEVILPHRDTNAIAQVSVSASVKVSVPLLWFTLYDGYIHAIQ